MPTSVLHTADQPATNDVPRARSPWRRRIRRTLLSVAALMLLSALVLLHSTSWTAAFGGTAQGERLARVQASVVSGNGRFWNPTPGLMEHKGDQWAAMRELLRGAPGRRPPKPLPVAPREEILATLRTPPASGLRTTWIGHSTLLIEIDGRRILTDPMFSNRASPSTLLGAKRFQPPALTIEDLPPVDAVLLSHDHYDHLDLASIRALDRRGVMFYTPLGVGAHLERWGVPPERIVEHDWWEKSVVAGITLIATPAHHFSGRRLIDYNRTLWCSWVIAGPKHRVFFSGDSGLAWFCEEIGRRHGPFDVAFMDIGAWHESWGDIHFGPRGATAAFEMLNARRFMPIHWGTFTLAPQPWDEPVETLLAVAAERRIDVLTPILGAPVEPEHAVAPPPWWRVKP